MDIFEAKHQQNMVRYAKQIDKIFFWVCQSAAHIWKSAAGGVAEFDTEMFQFSDYPKVQEQVDALLKKMHADIEATVFQGVEQEWSLANKKHDKLTKEVLGQRLAKMNQEQYKRYFNSNQAGLEAFKNRQISGLNLSDRVWKYTNGFKSEIEAALSLSLEQGKSAQKVAKELKQYLQEPNRLYRRVKDKYGNLVPSKAMAAYHPGAGVYRSSYMNARRLAVTETNIAFRTSDYLRIQDEDFVVGIRVVLSNNHTCKGVQGVYFDICDELQGDYPKDFKFTGWHPHCRCHTETILKTDEEMDADFDRILKGEEPTSESVNEVKGTPDNFNKWLKNNEERIAKAKNKPYFIKDNPEYTTNTKSISISKAESKPAPVEVSAESVGETAVNKPTKTNIKPMSYEDVKKKGWEIEGIDDSKSAAESWKNSEMSKIDYNKLENEVKAAIKDLGLNPADTAFSIYSEVFEDNMELSVFHPAGINISRFFVKIDGVWTVKHSFFALKDTFQGQGFSKKILKAFLDQYERCGVKRIDVHANINIGGYTWARYGFTAKKDGVDEIIRLCNNKRIKKEAEKVVKAYYASHDITTRFPMNLLAKEPWGKELLLGTNWDGEIDMFNEEVMKIFKKYLE